jgi:16S rRNA (guanine527-N7)-methyltransferase
MTANVSAVLRWLGEARDLGFLGPGPVEDHLLHSEGFVRALADLEVATLIDLGSGGGVPGLLLAARRSAATVVLIDSHQRRTAFLERCAGEMSPPPQVVTGRAEQLAHDPTWRHSADVVVARSFGPPAATAECATGFLRRGGFLLVSEPPDAPDFRWPVDGLERLGLRRHDVVTMGAAHIRRLEQVRTCDPTVPRRVGRPKTAPMW